MWLLRQIFITDRNFFENLGIDPATFDRVKNLFFHLKDQYVLQQDPYWQCRGRSYFIELLVLIERLSAGKESNNFKEFTVSKEFEEIFPVITYLNNSYNDKITIDDLSKRFYTNRTSLNNKFLKATGYSPINYLIKLRIQTASIMLQDTSIPIAEIVDRTGFDDPTHFGRMFKKYTGLNPSSFRNNFKLPSYIKL